MTSSQVIAANLLAELVSGGVEHVFIAPGSRSQALAIAAQQLAQVKQLNLHVVLDERSMGFQALGVARATGNPVALVTTSGTAVANLHPAVLEAFHSSVPLVLLTADRPTELRGVGANQTTQQLGLFGSAVRECIALDDATAEDARAAAVRALHVSQGYALNPEGVMFGGPVQINIGFREPLADLEPRAEDLLHHGPWQHELDFPLAPAVEIDLGKKTIIIAGDSAGEEDVPDGIPIFAEPSSNLRWLPEAIQNYHVLFEDEVLLSQVEQILIFGKPTLSRQIQKLVRELRVEKYAIPGRHRVYQPTPTVTQVFAVEYVSEPSESWLNNVVQLAQERSIIAMRTDDLNNDWIVSQVYEASDEDDAVVFGASNIIRQADRSESTPQVQIFANRGLAGIDGTIAFARGIALSGFFKRVRAVIGDLTAIHDLSSLAQEVTTAQHLQLQIIVANDGGGRIFEKLEVAHLLNRENFEQLFVTSHEVDFGKIAAGYGWDFVQVRTVRDLDEALKLQGQVLIECVTNGLEL
ncbi:MAG: 2-succinyl-5-enolpyruvyl-6-hydroxy-3-cyclohexene-1-carboxylic-acid synthase [Micrococcales bacterium]